MFQTRSFYTARWFDLHGIHGRVGTPVPGF